ncbi:arginase family protein [Salinibacterium sp. SYSU T00001]|uniref:arginase family protein n=1 Tax=Homoserinimonas sedimenticola TaxID=2986805 RepID=UPI002235485E|nr:arginase family protein [Salinibacterium sedimenticola]MCW4386637.1 arginase family protein [Salinibacterium sedimenticola]
MTASFFVVPQWQGSASARAMRLADGALAISRDLPSSSTTLVEVPAEAGDDQGCGVARCSSIMTVRDRVAEALAQRPGPAVTIGGDCGVELAAVSHVVADDVALLWFDAHPDLNTPESSPSSAFTGMVLRTLLGDGASPLVPERPLDPSRVVLVGARALDDAEEEYVRASGIRMLGAEVSAQAVLDAVAATGATRVYVHVDLDVLDPGIIAGLGAPVPFGISAEALVELLRAVVSRFPLAGAGLTEFAPASPDAAEDDLATILRIIGALTR